MENSAFAEMAENIEGTKTLESGDTCPEDCEKELHELNHERKHETDIPAHPDANNVEIVCVHHGIVAER